MVPGAEEEGDGGGSTNKWKEDYPVVSHDLRWSVVYYFPWWVFFLVFFN